MRNVCVVTGNMCEYSRLRSVMKAIENRKDLKLTLVVTASHLLDDYGKTIDYIKADGFKVNAVARTVAAGEDLISMAKSVGLGALELPTIFDLYKPDIVLIVGDRFDVLSAAISAVMMNIFLAHIQGGEITGTIDESVRHAITKLAHIHFVANEESAERVIKMGENPKSVIVTSCPSTDIILSLKPMSVKEACEEFNSRHVKAAPRLDPKEPFLILIQHPVTTEYEHAKEQIRATLEAISELNIQTVLVYPNVDAGSKDFTRVIRQFDNMNLIPRVIKVKPTEVDCFLQLLRHAACIVGNSSSGIREACYFGTPCVNMGTRQNGRTRGKNVIDVRHNKKEIKDAIVKQLEHGKYEPEFIYGEGNAGEKIAEILATCDISNIQKKLMY